MRRRTDKMMSKPKVSNIVVIPGKETCIIWSCGIRRIGGASLLQAYTNLPLRWQEKRSSSGHYKAERIEARGSGAVPRSSEEAPVNRCRAKVAYCRAGFGKENWRPPVVRRYRSERSQTIYRWKRQ